MTDETRAALNKIRAERNFDAAAKEQVEIVTNFLNGGFSKTAFVQAMTREHRYLQSEFTELCLKWLEECAKEEYPRDGRNEWCHTVGKRIQDAKLY